MRIRILLLCVLLSALWGGVGPAPAVGQSEATLRVLVKAATDGRPLQGANVRLTTSAADGPVRAGATNRDGYLRLSGLAPGRYYVEISYVGFRPRRDTLNLRPENRTYTVELQAQRRQLEEVTVEVTRASVPRQAGLETIRTEEIGRVPTPGPSGDLAAYLQTRPGVVSVGDRGGQLYIRGGAPTQNRYLIDGLPIVRPFHISSFYSAFPQNIVQSADLYAGGFGAEYGEALSAVLDVRLRPGNMKRFDGRASVGPHLASLSVEGPVVTGQQSFLLSGRYSLIDETAGPLFGQDASFDFYDVTGRYSFLWDEASCSLTGVFTNDQGAVGPDAGRRYGWSNTVVGGRCFIFEDQLDNTFSVRAGYTGFQNSVGTAGSPEQTARRWRLHLFVNYDQTLLGHPVGFGARVTAGAYGATVDRPFVGVEQFRRGQGMLRLHWTMDWEANDHLTLTPSLAALTTYALRPKVDPRLRLSILPDGTDQQEISLAVGLYHQIDEGVSDQRDAGNVFTVWRPPDRGDSLPRAVQAVAGYHQRLGPNLEVSVEGYARRLRNVPVSQWTPEAGFATETALARGVSYGADARLTLTRGSFYTYLSYGWSDVTYEAETDDLGAWVGGTVFSFPPAHDRHHQVNAVSSYEFMGVTASVSWEFGSGRPFTKLYGFDLNVDVPEENPTQVPGTSRTLFERPYGARLPAYHRLDVSLKRSFSLSERASLSAKVGAINLYDRRNVFYFDADTLQRVNQSPLLPYFSLSVSTNQGAL